MAREIWPDAPEFSASQSYSMRAPVEKELYRATKQLFESREGAIEKWVKAYETTSALRARAPASRRTYLDVCESALSSMAPCTITASRYPARTEAAAREGH